jgi:hypothetical protein
MSTFQVKLNKYDVIYLIKQGEIKKDKKYKVHSIEIKEDGNWHDGYIISYSAYIEELSTQLITFELLAVTSKMLQINDIYFIHC